MFLIQCYRKDDMKLDHEVEVDSFPKADSVGRGKRKGGFRVRIKRRSGLKHKEPMIWRWTQHGFTWKPIVWYDEYAAGKRPPKGASGLFE